MLFTKAKYFRNLFVVSKIQGQENNTSKKAIWDHFLIRGKLLIKREAAILIFQSVIGKK